MLRLRLASLALASGLLFLLSGCASTCEDSRFFPRLFRSNSMSYPASHGMPGECECHNSQFAPGMEMSTLPGPMFPQSAGVNQTMPIPITNIPPNQPPQIFKVPQALPTPYAPTH
jgi:hypothetical protein